MKTRRIWLLFPALFAVGLLVYKGTTSVLAIRRVWSLGELVTRTDIVSLDGTSAFTAAERSLHYFVAIWPALAFGILIAAAVRTFIPPEWFARIFSRGLLRRQLTAGFAGAPLMLCSCCIAPVFKSVYENSSRLGPSLAIMLASPSLNPAALVLTFMLFAPKIAAARLLMAVVAVCFGGVIVERSFSNVPSTPPRRSPAPLVLGWREAGPAFVRSLWHVMLRTLPVLVLGVVGSMFLAKDVPSQFLNSNRVTFFVVTATAFISVLLALPTFFEIPLALGLLAAGAPPGAAAALLFAGPAVNLPSLLTLARATNWKIAGVLAAFVGTIAVTGGLLLS
jgi:uncharacterized protein